eukprot:1200149-Alexandrium_andersonii.AAC.1
MTFHLHHAIGELLKEVVLRKGRPVVGDEADKVFVDERCQARYEAGIEEAHEYSFRWGYQGRGTIH